MADIELVIKMPEKTINEIKDNAMFAGSISSDVRWDVTSAIVNGTPLPKGHGRLIDADKLEAELKEHHDFYINAYGGFSNLPINDKSRVDEITGSIASVVNSKTIIEADKAESEDKE